jgi:hypothetical protein
MDCFPISELRNVGRQGAGQVRQPHGDVPILTTISFRVAYRLLFPFSQTFGCSFSLHPLVSLQPNHKA